MLKEMKRQCKKDQEPPTAPSSSSRVNEDNFQLMFGRLDVWTLWPLAWGTSRQAWTTSHLWLLKDSQLMMRTLLVWLNPWRKSMSVWGIMAYSYLFSFLFFMMPRGRKDNILYVFVIGIMYLIFWLCIMYWLNQINGKKILNGCWKYLNQNWILG